MQVKTKMTRSRLNTHKPAIAHFAENAAKSASKGALVLDAGAGDSPYKKYFDHCKYEATDISIRDAHDYQEVTMVCDLTSIPVENSKYDLVLCTQVLEHVSEPGKVLKEINRVLKKGGKLWLSTPLYYPEHEIPYDYYRYTQYGLTHLFESAGFSVEKIEWATGYFATLSYQLRLGWHYLPKYPKDAGGGFLGWAISAIMLFIRPILFICAIVLALLDIKYKYTSKGHCIDYCVIAQKN